MKKGLSVFCFLFLGILIGSLAQAADIVVNSAIDDVIPTDGKCTLREAIIAANTDTESGSTNGECRAGSGADNIFLEKGIYFLSITGAGEDAALTGDLDITDDVKILGEGANKTFINADKIDRVFDVFGPSVVKIKDLTIQNGVVVDGGGGIKIDSLVSVKIKKCNISNNYAIEAGGGIINRGTLTIVDSSISSNLAVADRGVGGGIAAAFGTLTVKRSSISHNSAIGLSGEATGGGIYQALGTLNIIESTIFGNNCTSSAADSIGGGIVCLATSTITRTTVSKNSAIGIDSEGGGIWTTGNLTLSDSVVENNSAAGVTTGNGGGIFNNISGIGGTLTLEDGSKVIRNFATDDGGGIYESGGTVNISSDSKVAKNIPNDSAP